MSEFEKELESILEKNGEYYQGITTGNVLGISKHFKDWQPPKPLVVVPQFVADWFEKNEDDLSFKIWGYLINWKLQDKKSDFFRWMKKESECIEILIRMQDGYIVKKEQMFYLKNVMTNNYLMQHKLDFFGESDSKEDSPHWQTKFNQSEIDKLNIGSYEQIEVKVDEVEK